jgi:hypothetical protein
MLEQLLNTGNCICGLSNAASSTVAKRILMFTSAVGFGEHHFLGVDKLQCPPYEKSLIVYC